MQLRQPQFTYSVCGKQKFKEIGSSQNIYQKELDKACVQHDMGYRDFKDLPEEQLLIKHCVIMHLILLKIQTWWVLKGSCFKGL